MPTQGWGEFVPPGPGITSGAALTNTVTATSLLHATMKPQLYANYWKPTKDITVVASGRISTLVTTPGTLTLDLRLGPADPPTIIVANGGAMALNVVAKTNVPWTLTWDLTCLTSGNGTIATLTHQGAWISEAVIGSAIPTVGGAGEHMLPNTAPGAGTGFSSVVGLFMDLFATWSVANAANSIQLQKFRVHEWN